MALLFQASARLAFGLAVLLVPGFRPAWPLVLLVLLLLLSRLFLALEGRKLASLGLALGRPWFRSLGAGLGIGAGVIGASALLLWAAGGCRPAFNAGASPGAVAGGLLFLLVPGINEELTYRGYSFQRVLRRLGRWPALLLLSALFALDHRANPNLAPGATWLPLVNIGLAGLLLGLAYLRTGSLAMPIGIHLGWNWAQGPLLGFAVSGQDAAGLLLPRLQPKPAWLTGGGFGLEGSVLCTIACLAACVLVARARKAVCNQALAS
ncbi:CPBP family glutamic-type intramembrane protease [Mesoterricola sediminis]|uniref:CAAX prenyl protease 2/Lysostaphin resistance protein A-like domain-containing protein n=1 Tax=Mesoterricola sediminis TaxID=2927980 RepID=A0AA48KHW7_9BACT|nr:CPBP family glutamic-type intramembrane protease [Mesoterricola sediminis]BDU78773.1 hypothetical protein METESE_37310 [Mesoterricola sediminis]